MMTKTYQTKKIERKNLLKPIIEKIISCLNAEEIQSLIKDLQFNDGLVDDMMMKSLIQRSSRRVEANLVVKDLIVPLGSVTFNHSRALNAVFANIPFQKEFDYEDHPGSQIKQGLVILQKSERIREKGFLVQVEVISSHGRSKFITDFPTDHEKAKNSSIPKIMQEIVSINDEKVSLNLYPCPDYLDLDIIYSRARVQLM